MLLVVTGLRHVCGNNDLIAFIYGGLCVVALLKTGTLLHYSRLWIGDIPLILFFKMFSDSRDVLIFKRKLLRLNVCETFPLKFEIEFDFLLSANVCGQPFSL